jgi:hypothetical protein
MAKVYFYYYQSSPRISISHTEEMENIPMVGDVISVINSEFCSLNKKIKDKNFLIKFKVIEREFIKKLFFVMLKYI